jgi:hypothetical protein
VIHSKEIDWNAAEQSLWGNGYARLGRVFSGEECRAFIDLYPRDELFRSRIEMRRYRFGEGDYKYFSHPLPDLIRIVREDMFERIAPIANRWMEASGSEVRYPPDLATMLEQCHEAGQTKPTPLLLHYEAGGYNCLHQDLYGDLAFPFQIVCFLSQPGRDYTGGEFLLVEQRPRAQSIGQVMQANEGEALLFTTRYRPVKGTRGYYRANVKHGVSKVLSGTRYTLGIIFHDAK